MAGRELGSWGEERAAQYLRRRGYKILARNYSCRGGEIDVIASRGKYVAFVEVKLRKSAAFAEAREFVTRAKQQRIIMTAELWLGELLAARGATPVYTPLPRFQIGRAHV